MAGTYTSLNDGTWQTFSPTVTLTGGAGNTVPVFTTNTGRYMTIGKICFVQVYLNGDGGAAGAGSGQIGIALPIAVGASQPAGGTNLVIGAALLQTINNAFIFISSLSGSTLLLARHQTVNNTGTLTGSDFANTTRSFRLAFWYEID